MLTHIYSNGLTFLKREDGPTAVEYAVVLAFIVSVCIGTISAVGSNAPNVFGKSAEAAEPSRNYGIGEIGSGGDKLAPTGTYAATGTFGNFGMEYDAATGVVTAQDHHSGNTFQHQLDPGRLPSGFSSGWRRER